MFSSGTYRASATIAWKVANILLLPYPTFPFLLPLWKRKGARGQVRVTRRAPQHRHCNCCNPVLAHRGDSCVAHQRFPDRYGDIMVATHQQPRFLIMLLELVPTSTVTGMIRLDDRSMATDHRQHGRLEPSLTGMCYGRLVGKPPLTPSHYG